MNRIESARARTSAAGRVKFLRVSLLSARYASWFSIHVPGQYRTCLAHVHGCWDNVDVRAVADPLQQGAVFVLLLTITCHSLACATSVLELTSSQICVSLAQQYVLSTSSVCAR